MKTINYQFFIYFFLTIIYGAISTDNKLATPKPQTNHSSDKCNLRTLFSTLKSTKDCPRIASNLTELNTNSVSAYLCTGIVHGVQKICQLSLDNPSTTVTIDKSITEFENEIKKLSSNKTISEFCSSMGKSISNSSYIETIKNETDIIKLKTGLDEFCGMMCGNFEKRIEPVCSMLLWLNRLLADTEIRVKTITKKNESAQILPVPNNSLAKAVELQKKEGQASNKVGDANLPDKPPQNDSKKKQEESVNKDHVGSKSELGKGSTASKSNDNTPELPKKKVKDIPQTQPEIEGGMQEEAPIRSQGPGLEDEITEDDKTPILDSQDVDPNQSIEPGDEETDLHKSNVPSPEDKAQELKNKITHQKEAENGKNDPNIDRDYEKVHEDKDGDVEIDPSETDLPDVNELPVVAHPGPPEPPQHFFAYFMAISLTCLVCYIGYHKKQKIMAIVFEGRKSRGGRGRRRPNTANYRKLDCTLEEAVTSQCNSNVTHVIY